jgi:endothelin-converting enzyme
MYERFTSFLHQLIGFIAIVQAFHDKLPRISWMDKESAAAAQKKANGILPKVGYPLAPNTTEPMSLSSWYSRLNVQDSDFFGNVVRSTLTEEARAWNTLGRARNRDSWMVSYYCPRSVVY